MIPAIRAVCSGSPFFITPPRTWRTASGDIVMRPRATASLVVTALLLTSTIRTFPVASMWDSRGSRPSSPVRPRRAPETLLVAIAVSLCEKEREALERHRQVDALDLDVGGHLQRPRREVQHRLDARGDDLVDHRLCGGSRNGNHRDANAVAARVLAEGAGIENRHAAARTTADLVALGVEQRGNLEPLGAKTLVVSERQAEVAGAHDRHPHTPVEAQDLTQVGAQLAHVIAD